MRQERSTWLAIALVAALVGGCHGSCDDDRVPVRDHRGSATEAAVSSTSPTSPTSQPTAADLVVYYSWGDRTAGVLLEEFSASTGVTVSGMRRSSRHLVKLIEAEAGEPQASVLFAGPAPSYEMLQQAGLLQPYRPAGAEAIPAEFRDPDDMWFGMYLGAIAFGTDRRLVDEIPRSYEDLLRLRLAQGVTYSNPATSGTAYTFLLGLIALRGEEGAFDYLARLHPKVAELPSGGAMTLELVNLGEASVAIAFSHDVLQAGRRNPHLQLSFPAEGSGWEIGCAALLAGAPHPELGKRLLDFLAKPTTQELLWRKADFPVYPTHPAASPPPGAPPLGTIKRVSIDVIEAGRRWDDRAMRYNRRFPRRR